MCGGSKDVTVMEMCLLGYQKLPIRVPGGEGALTLRQLSDGWPTSVRGHHPHCTLISGMG
ncbi:hypothetical protein I79_007630 [Cricetulus griseus]|uniref:Uncharacterized protein n=1 Tax=Cricetulus griseus TaxID=10029 RepID=G3HB17_CRIGR|nr:hypothetical protein I79_007630 [Cricetulus griseus]